MFRTTTIAGREVPVEPGRLVTVQFSAGRGGPAEAGVWEFWTIVNDEAASTARCREGHDPGERFRRMEGVQGYERHWQVAATSKAIRPATLEEVTNWLNGHAADAQFVEACRIDGKDVKVVNATQSPRSEK